MRKCTVLLVLLAMLAAVAWAGCDAFPQCPMHNTGMYDTGQSKYVNGHRWQLFRCPSGSHTVWMQCD